MLTLFKSFLGEIMKTLDLRILIENCFKKISAFPKNLSRHLFFIYFNLKKNFYRPPSLDKAITCNLKKKVNHDVPNTPQIYA